MSWAKVNVGTYLQRRQSDFGPLPPSDYWVQADVWIPSRTFTACNGDLNAFSAEFLTIWNVGFSNPATTLRTHDTSFGVGPPNWVWYSDQGGSHSPGPSPNTPYTVKVHWQNGVADWYVNGVFLFHQTGLAVNAPWWWRLGWGANRCCCEIYYFTNFKAGTSDGGTDLFEDDFSGGLGNWQQIGATVFNGPIFDAVVDEPADDVCPTITISPVRGQPGSPLTISGHDFPPDDPLELQFGFGIPVEEFAAVSDGAGSFSQTLTVPEGIGSNFPTGGWDVRVRDDQANVACGKFSLCGPHPADGISTAAPSKLADAGTYPYDANYLIDYVFYAGSHWILWANPQVGLDAGAFPPPPADVAMYATEISADGATVTTHEIDWDPMWVFGSGNVDDPGLGDNRDCHGTTVGAPNWERTWFFDSWAKPIYDAHFATDGATLWVAVVTKETVPYPYLDNLDQHGINPGSAAQFVPLATLTSGFTSFPRDVSTGFTRIYTNTFGAIGLYKDQAFPVTDAGDNDSGYWTTPCVRVFAFDGAFNEIGHVSAKYCPGVTLGNDHGNSALLGVPLHAQATPRGTLFSRVAICASPNDPGRCHVVWSEGGDWGRVGLGDASCRRLLFDAGPENKSYRTNYTTWAGTGKLTDSELWESYFARGSFQLAFDGDSTVYPTGYTWPDAASFAGILDFALRNDNPAGVPYLFVCPPVILTDTYIPVAGNAGTFAPPPAYTDMFGNPQMDHSLVYSDTLHVYDLSGGGAALANVLDLSTLGPSEEEYEFFYLGSTLTPPVGPADAVFSPRVIGGGDDRFGGGEQVISYAAPDKSFGVSLPYDDPELGDTPVYLFHLPLIKRFIPSQPGFGGPPVTTNKGAAALRGFYRVPCDMGGPFEYLDGDRQAGFTLVKLLSGFGFDAFGSNDFFSDPHNIWVPTAPSQFAGNPGEWFDRICKSVWEGFGAAWTPFTVSNFAPPSATPGFYYDPVSDSIAYASITTVSPGISPVTTLSIIVQYICRGCQNCSCGNGVHIAHRF